MVIADVGCFSGALSLMMADRGAPKIYAVDEMPEHLEQCALCARLFNVPSIECILASAYRLRERIQPASLDLIMLSCVLYHLSDMLVGLYAMQELLKPTGVLLIESYAVPCFEHSYANFGRFVGGGWWQPTALCIQDMCRFTGLDTEVRFYCPDRCIARAVKSEHLPVRYTRGMNFPFEDIHDKALRTTDLNIMAPAECTHLDFDKGTH